MSPSWKREHITAFIPISPPFGGAVSTVKAVVSGDTLGFPLVSHSIFHPIQSTCASGPWLFPQPSLWPESEVLVTSASPTTNLTATYTSTNYTELTRTLGLNQVHHSPPPLTSHLRLSPLTSQLSTSSL